MNALDLAAQILLITCVVPVNLYVLFYAFRPFWVTPQGRALMIKAAGNAVLLDLGLSVVIFGPDYMLRPYVRIAAFTLFGIGIWYLFIALMRSPASRDYPPYTWWAALKRALGRQLIDR